MVAVRIIALPLVGATSALGASSPLIHIGVTKSNYRTKWYERFDFSQPIFKNCKYENNNPLNVYLTLELGGASTSINSKKVSLKVVEKTKEDEERVINWRENSEQDVWKELKLQYSTDKKEKVTFLYPYKNSWEDRIWAGQAICENGEKIKFTEDSSSFRNSEYIYLKDIELTFQENCKEGFGSVECEISIGPKGKIKWVEGFKPKVIYTAF